MEQTINLEWFNLHSSSKPWDSSQVWAEIWICCSKRLQLQLADVGLLALWSDTMLSALLASLLVTASSVSTMAVPRGLREVLPLGQHLLIVIKHRKITLSGNRESSQKILFKILYSCLLMTNPGGKNAHKKILMMISLNFILHKNRNPTTWFLFPIPGGLLWGIKALKIKSTMQI